LLKIFQEKKELELKLLRKEQEMKSLQENQEAEKKSKQEKHEANEKSKHSNIFMVLEQLFIYVAGVNDWKCGLKMIKSHQLNQGGGRVMAYCPWETQLAVSRASILSGYVVIILPHFKIINIFIIHSFGLTLFNCERDFHTKMDSFHGQSIRDLQYCPNRSNSILLSGSLDKSSKMIDFRSNSIVQSYRVSYSLLIKLRVDLKNNNNF
jgi:hypothetical protein